MSPPDSPTLAARLARSRVGLNPDLEVSRHVIRGVASYVVRNPLTLESHLVSASDYRVLTRIRSERSLGELFGELVADGVLTAEREEGFYRFVLGLHRLGFLQLPISDEQQLYRRHVTAQRARRWKHLTSVFFLQVPLFNPDALLERTAAVGRVVFSKGFLALWSALVGFALFLAVRNAGELAGSLRELGAAHNLPYLFGVLLGLKLLHEFGHGYACKRFGGQVPEMGVYLIVFTPCAYVDTTSAWSFPRKGQRLLVCLAGMYVELFCAALGLLVWAATGPSALHQVAFNVAVLGSVVTVGLNVNPLMRFDGYYALSDLVEVPNLRARAQAELARTFKRLAFGLRTPGGGEGVGLRAFLTTFGVASGVYKVTLVLVLSAVIAKTYPVVGLLLAGVYVAMEVVRLVRRAVRTFFLSPETAGVRRRAALVGVVLLVLLPAGVCFLPVPSRVVAPATLSAETVDVLRAERPGFLAELCAEPDREVLRGETLAVLEDVRVEEAVIDAQGRLELARIELLAARAVDDPRAPELAERVRYLEHELATRAREREKLTLRAPRTGPLVALASPDERGRFVAEGEALATIVSGPVVALAALTESEVERARPSVGDRVDFRPASDPARTLTGTIARISPVGSPMDPTAPGSGDDADLAAQGGAGVHVTPDGARAGVPHFVVTVRLDPTPEARLWHGGTGRVRLQGTFAPMATVATVALRNVLNLRNRLADRG